MQRFEPHPAQQAWSSLVFISFPVVLNHTEVWESLSYVTFAVVTHMTCQLSQIIMGSSGKLCWPSAVQKIKLRLFEGHRTSQSLGWPKNPVLLPIIPTVFTVLPTHTNTTHSLNYCISSNWASAIGSLLCKFDSFILENPTSLPRKSYHLSRPTWEVLSSFLNIFVVYSFAITSHWETKSTFHISVMTQHFALCIYFLAYIFTLTFTPHTQNWKQKLYVTHLYSLSI